MSGSYLGVSGRYLGEYRCHINHKQSNRSHHIKLLPFLPRPKSTKFWGVCGVSGGCLEGVWRVLGDSGYCLEGYNAKSIDKSPKGIVLISWFVFSQWLSIGQHSQKIENVILLGPRFFLAESMWSFRQNTLYLPQVSGLGGDGPWF